MAAHPPWAEPGANPPDHLTNSQNQVFPLLQASVRPERRGKRREETAHRRKTHLTRWHVFTCSELELSFRDCW